MSGSIWRPPTRRAARRVGRRASGFTLVELLMAVAILAGVAMLIYSAFSGMKRSKEGIERVADRYREGRLAMRRLATELQSAYVSMHVPIDPNLMVVRTAFVGRKGSPADRLDFNAFANRRLDRDSHESDQCELSYFGSTDPDPHHGGVVDLARRISKRPDLDPQKGGRVDVLATDIDLFDLKYLDPLSGNWQDTWSTKDAIGQPNRLPLQVRVALVLNGGRRTESWRAPETIKFLTKIPLAMQSPLTFAIQ